jgi:hypothetical protein
MTKFPRSVPVLSTVPFQTIAERGARTRNLCFAVCFALIAGVAQAAEPPATATPTSVDVVVYGGTSGGIAAAIQVRRMGKSVVLVEPSKFLGGLSAGGLGATDIGNKAAIGGIAREFYRRVGDWYRDPAHWTRETAEAYFKGRKGTGEAEQWTFEPHVATAIYRAWLEEVGVPVVTGERLVLARTPLADDLRGWTATAGGVVKRNGRIVEIRMESGRIYKGSMFIDATYEGDLLALAGVSYHVGREANRLYGETLNGIEVRHSTKHQFIVDVDPFVKKGDPTSGLLPLIQAGGPGEDGAGDHRLQAYNFRLCTTDVAANRREWPKPAGYDPARYELLLRNFEAGDHRSPWNPIFMPNRKTDTNNNFAISTDHIGANYEYPDGDHATRERIYRDHVEYQQGLMHTLANHPRVPEKIRAEFQRLGLAKDEFVETDNWPHQMYVREARRLVGEYVMTQHDCQGLTVPQDPVGLGAYNMDSHNCQRYVDARGFVRNEGDVQVGVSPYRVSYRSVIPKRTECENLLVPVCLSATHIAYGSIRMEPVFMVLGQSCATAACLAIDDRVPVQGLEYARLRSRLLADGQALDWVGASRAAVVGVDPAKLAGLVVDNPAAALTGPWESSASISGFVGADYLHDGNGTKGNCSATFTFEVREAGRYSVLVHFTPNANRATNVPVSLTAGAVKQEWKLDQRSAKGMAEGARSLGEVELPAGKVRVMLTNAGTDGHVIVDAVRLVRGL